jgi:hypothetical protein
MKIVAGCRGDVALTVALQCKNWERPLVDVMAAGSSSNREACFDSCSLFLGMDVNGAHKNLTLIQINLCQGAIFR